MNFAVVIMLSNYFHDLATGLLFGSMVAYFVAVRAVEGRQPGLDRALFARFRPIVKWALAAVLLLGVPRMIFYYDYEYLPAAGRDQITALIVKHVFLVGVTVGSLVTFFRANPDKRHAE
jgi:hypothetical protein